MKPSDESQNNTDNDYGAVNGALDATISYEPNPEQLDQIQRHIIHLELCQLETFINENNLDIQNALIPGDEKQILTFYWIKIKNEENWLKAVKFLVEKFRLPGDFKDNYQQTLLFYVWREGYTSLVDFLVTQCQCDLDQRDMYHQTPVYYAWRENRVQTLLKLFEFNIDITVIDDQGQTPLFYASQKGNLEIWRLLVDKGSDVNAKDKKNISPIQVAQKYKRYDVVNFLEENGAEVPETWKTRRNVPAKKGKGRNAEEPKDYVLTVLRNGRYVNANWDDLDDDFALKFPELHEWLKTGDIEGFKRHIKMIDFPSDKTVYITWVKVAQRILNHLK
jgi:hypothetical protein